MMDVNGIWMPIGVYVCLVFSMKALMYGQSLCMFNMLWDIN